MTREPKQQLQAPANTSNPLDGEKQWPRYYRYWGKSGGEGSFHRLVYHCLDVAAVAKVLLETDGFLLNSLSQRSGLSPNSIQQSLPVLVALHDLGKFAATFQGLRPDLREKLGMPEVKRAYTERHDFLGYELWENQLLQVVRPANPEIPDFQLNEATKAWMRAVTGHHGAPPMGRNNGLEGIDRALIGQQGYADAEGFSRELLEMFGSPVWVLKKSPGSKQSAEADSHKSAESDEIDWRAWLQNMQKSSWLVAGLCVLCDWLGSDIENFPYVEEEIPLKDYWAEALINARKAVQKSGLSPAQPHPGRPFAEIFPQIPQPSSLQELTASLEFAEGPQLFLIEEVTGAGKTEAALHLAHRLMAAGYADGLYVALPTMATANAMHERVERIYPTLYQAGALPELVLAHGMARQVLADRVRNVEAHNGQGAPLSAAEVELASSDGALPSEQAVFRPATPVPPSKHNAGAEALSPSQERDFAHEAPQSSQHLFQEWSASQEQRSWLADRRKASLLAQVGVGTIDQALLGALKAKHNSLRLLGLHRHVLIVDEVHACDAYMNSILETLLEAHAALGGSAILLSATLPMATRKSLVKAFQNGVLGRRRRRSPLASRANPEPARPEPQSSDYPLLTQVDRNGCQEHPLKAEARSTRRVEVASVDSFEESLNKVVAAAERGECAVWVRNTVNDALSAHEALQERLGPDNVTLFHARFCLFDRLRIERNVVSRFGRTSTFEQRKGQVVVATQVVEQSLDIDFDFMLSDLAPIDLILQRAGRLHRHVRSDRPQKQSIPKLHIFAPPFTLEPEPSWPGKEFSGTAAVYRDKSILWFTQRVLERKGELSTPRDSRELLEEVFGSHDLPEGLERSALEAEGKRAANQSVAAFNAIKFEAGYDAHQNDWQNDTLIPTRLADEPSRQLRLSRFDGKTLRPLRGSRWHESSVSARASRVVKRAAATWDAAVEVLEAELPKRGEDALTLVFEEHLEGWRAEVLDKSDRLVSATYHPNRGLELSVELDTHRQDLKAEK